MSLLVGHKVIVIGGMSQRPLARLLASFGADIVTPQEVPLGEASFFIDDIGLTRLAETDYAQERLTEEFPSLIHGSVTPFGSFGPRATWRGNEFIASAMSGTLILTGDPDRRPVKEALDACTFHADMVAAAGLMAAHWERARSGRGQHIDVSIQEVAFNRNVNGAVVWQFDRRKLSRAGGALNYGKAKVRCIWPLADGWCFHSLMTGRFGAPANQALSGWMDELNCDNPMRNVDWLAYDRSALPAETRAVWEKAIEAFFRTRTKSDIGGEGRKRGINACIVAPPEDVLRDPHLEARRFWRVGDGVKEPSRFVSIRDGNSGSRRDDKAGGGRPGPLSGVRVLDFSWALVGSITTKTLGDLGADVIKVESRARPCLSRIDVQVGVSRPGEFDDKPWFAHLNTSKRSLALDLKHPGALEVLLPLVEWADIVVENFSPGTMKKLGLGYDTLSSHNPGIILVSGSVYGQSGPLAHEWGVDGTGGALSARTYLTGWPDRGPVIPGAVPYGDVVVPFVMAAAAAAGLQRRRETGKGAHIDVSMYEVCVQQMRDAIVRTQCFGPMSRTGNQSESGYRQDVYPVQGADRWVALSATSPEEWERVEALAKGAAFEEWTATQKGEELVDRIQGLGIAAGLVQDIEDLMERDPQLAFRGALANIEHGVLGEFGHMRTPITFSRSETDPFRAPNIGEHSIDIATGESGLSRQRVETLLGSGVFR